LQTGSDIDTSNFKDMITIIGNAPNVWAGAVTGVWQTVLGTLVSDTVLGALKLETGNTVPRQHALFDGSSTQKDTV
jgi:hypothetical protein